MQTIFPKSSPLGRDDIPRIWSRLGIAYAVTSIPGHADLEKALLLSLNHASQNRKTLRILCEWLAENADLVHVERLIGLARNLAWTTGDKDRLEVRTLGAIASYLTASGDRRWQVVTKLCHSLLDGASERLPVDPDANFLLQRDGSDPYFAKFGVTIPTLLPLTNRRDQLSHAKKLHTREHILAQNPWLRLRVALGANWRADVLFVFLTSLAANPHRAARLLSCSYETAHRIWSAAESAQAAELFRVKDLVGARA